MTDAIKIIIDSQAAEASLAQLAERAADTTPLMRKIAGHLRDVAEESFATETAPDGTVWAKLSPLTVALRQRRGHWPGSILQVSGKLSASVTTDYGNGWAVIGSNRPYARIQHKGGQAGRGHKAHIPARPFLGVSDEAEEAIIDDVAAFFDLSAAAVNLER